MSTPKLITKPEQLEDAVRLRIVLGEERREEFFGETETFEERTDELCDTEENHAGNGPGWVLSDDGRSAIMCSACIVKYYLTEDKGGQIEVLATGYKCSICGHLEESQDGMQQHYYGHDETLRALDDVLDKLGAGTSAAADLANRNHYETAYRALLEHVEGSIELLGDLVKKRLHPEGETP